MPEITSVEEIRKKVQQFDTLMDGAIAAARTLARVKTDAEQRLQALEGLSDKGDQALRRAAGIRSRLQEIQAEWGWLKQEVAKAQTDAEQTRDSLRAELDHVTQSLSKSLAEAEQRLRSTNQTSLDEQAELLQRLELETRNNAQMAEQASAVARDRANDLDELLATLRYELKGDVSTRLQDAEDRLESQGAIQTDVTN